MILRPCTIRCWIRLCNVGLFNLRIVFKQFHQRLDKWKKTWISIVRSTWTLCNRHRLVGERFASVWKPNGVSVFCLTPSALLRQAFFHLGKNWMWCWSPIMVCFRKWFILNCCWTQNITEINRTLGHQTPTAKLYASHRSKTSTVHVKIILKNSVLCFDYWFWTLVCSNKEHYELDKQVVVQ